MCSKMKLVCDICDVYLPSEVAFQEHQNGKRHKKRLAQRDKEKDKLKCQAYVTWKKELDKVQLELFVSEFGPVNDLFLNKEKHFSIVEFQHCTSCYDFLSNDKHRLPDGTEIFVKARRATAGKKRSASSPEPAEKLIDDSAQENDLLQSQKHKSKKAKIQLMQPNEECSRPEKYFVPKDTGMDSQPVTGSLNCASLLTTPKKNQDHSQLGVHDYDQCLQNRNILLTNKSPNIEDVKMSQTEICEQNIDNHLKALVENLQLTEDDLAERQCIASHVKSILDPVFGFQNVEVCPFGSSANGMGIRGCDLDLTLLVDPSIEVEYLIKEVRQRLSSQRPKKFINIQVIPSKRCPIVRFASSGTGLKCDLSFNNRLALKNTEVLKYLGEVVAPFRTICISVRKWAGSVGVGANFSGGPKLTHYALYMLVWFYLQSKLKLPSFENLSHKQDQKEFIEQWDCTFPFHLPEVFQSDLSSSLSLCHLLIGFFDFYKNIDFKDHILSIRTGELISVDQFNGNEKFRRSPMMVQDPFLLEHNITQNVTIAVLVELQTSFKEAAAICTSPCFWSTRELFEKESCGENLLISPENNEQLWGLSLLLNPKTPVNVSKGRRPMKL